MVKINSLVFLLIGVVGGVMNAQANSPERDHDLNASLTWEQFKEACLHPELFHQQVPPSNIRIQCTGVEVEFVPAAPGQLPLPGNSKTISAVFSNKYHVMAESKEYPRFEKIGSCLRFKEIEKTVTLEKVISCEDALGMKSELGEYCSSVISLSKGSSAKLVDVRDTHRSIDTCGSSAIISTKAN